MTYMNEHVLADDRDVSTMYSLFWVEWLYCIGFRKTWDIKVLGRPFKSFARKKRDVSDFYRLFGDKALRASPVSILEKFSPDCDNDCSTSSIQLIATSLIVRFPK